MLDKYREYYEHEYIRIHHNKDIDQEEKEKYVYEKLFNIFTPAEQIRITNHCLFNVKT